MTPNEERILAIVRELKPFERIEISKDQTGRMDSYLIHRSQKIVLTVKKSQGTIDS